MEGIKRNVSITPWQRDALVDWTNQQQARFEVFRGFSQWEVLL
jgi:hypothetical protein